MVRRPRDSGQPIVVITGISGRLGRLLAQRLHLESAVVGIDRRPFRRRPKDIQLFQADIRRKRCETVFRRYAGRIAAVYHLNIMHDPRIARAQRQSFNLVGTQRVLDYCQRFAVPKLIVLSSAGVYGPRPSNPQFITEDAPLLAGERFEQVQDLVAVDMMAHAFFWKHPEVETVILRPMHIVGRVKNAVSNYLRMRAIPVPLGFDPLLQLIHESDVVEALLLARRPGVRGVFNLAGTCALPVSAVLRELGKPVLPVPHPLLYLTAQALHAGRLTTFPPEELDYLRFTLLVDTTRAERDLGFAPRVSARATIRSLVDENLYDERV